MQCVMEQASNILEAKHANMKLICLLVPNMHTLFLRLVCFTSHTYTDVHTHTVSIIIGQGETVELRERRKCSEINPIHNKPHPHNNYYVGVGGVILFLSIFTVPAIPLFLLALMTHFLQTSQFLLHHGYTYLTLE